MTATTERAVGSGVRRIEGPAKVRGRAPYAFEHELDAQAVFVALVQSTVARGRVTRVRHDTRADLW